MGNIKFCRKCHENHEETFNGYFNWLKEDCYECPIKSCGSKLEVLNIDAEEFGIICNVSHDNAFLEAIIELKEKDPIEYQLKLSQFKTQVQQQENTRAQAVNTVKCPRCGSTNITAGQRGFSLLTGFVGSRRTGNRCANCGHKWKP